MIESQAVSLAMAACFCLIYGMSKSKTYYVLAIIYTVSASIHWIFQYVPSHSAWWPALYSTLDVCALTIIVCIGDIRVKFQMICISALIALHGLLAYDLNFGVNIVFSIYYQTVLTIIAAQIIAGFWDASSEYRRIYSSVGRNRKRCHHAQNHSKGVKV